MKYAVIDMGSNTIRLCIYEIKEGALDQILNRRKMALLGSKTQNGALTEEGIGAACDALCELQAVSQDYQVEALFVFATAAIRNISNTESVVSEIFQRTGISVDVLSGEEEAFLTFLGAAQAQSIVDGVIADIGGGSTELVLIKNGRPVQTASFPIGSLTAFVRFVKKRPAGREQIMAIRSYVRQLIASEFSQDITAEVLYGIGGATRAAHELEKVLYPSSGGAIPVLDMLLYRLLDDERLAEESILKASPERLDTALPGVAILCETAEFFGCKHLDVCKAGVREGYIRKQLGMLGNEGA